MTERFLPNNLTEAALHCVADLACLAWDTPAFNNLVRDAFRADVLMDCVTLGDYSRALLRFKLADLERLQAERLRREEA